jgi:sarcosine oxidase
MSGAFDVIVVGVGAMGSATCYHLARQGVSVLGLEQFDIPHGLGSSTGYSRMIRLAYFNQPDYVPLLRQAYLLWQLLESEYCQKIMHLTSGLYLGPPGSPVVEGSLRACLEHKLPHDRLSHRELARQHPQFKLREDYSAVLDQSAGLVLPERANCAHSELAMRHGAELHGREPVVEWHSDGKTVTVKTTRGAYQAAHVVFAGGSWSGKLLKEIGVQLVVTRQMLGWTWPRRPDDFTIGRFPVWILDLPDGENYYGFPMMPDNPGFKFASDKRGVPSDPDRLAREPTREDEECLRPFLKEYLPTADGPLLSIRPCMYTNSPDRQFILDHYPGLPNVTIACGFSGHGFKFATVIGQIMSELSLHGRSTLPIAFLSLDRFRHPA